MEELKQIELCLRKVHTYQMTMTSKRFRRKKQLWGCRFYIFIKPILDENQLGEQENHQKLR